MSCFFQQVAPQTHLLNLHQETLVLVGSPVPGGAGRRVGKLFLLHETTGIKGGEVAGPGPGSGRASTGGGPRLEATFSARCLRRWQRKKPETLHSAGGLRTDQ
ncbi:uncharacterized protein V6R79_016669 [Siganus canaliculatus]